MRSFILTASYVLFTLHYWQEFFKAHSKYIVSILFDFLFIYSQKSILIGLISKAIGALVLLLAILLLIGNIEPNPGLLSKLIT